MCDIIDYWVDLGVDGFRCDVIGFIAKDFEKGLMQNGPKLHEYIHELFGREKVKIFLPLAKIQWAWIPLWIFAVKIGTN